MKIHVFASLKDYMPTEFELDVSSVKNIVGVRELLKSKFPQAQELLNACRYSSETEMLSVEQEITHYENLFVIPPSSGG